MHQVKSEINPNKTGKWLDNGMELPDSHANVMLIWKVGDVTPPNFHLQATTEKFLMEKPSNAFYPTWKLNPGPHAQLSRLQSRDQRITHDGVIQADLYSQILRRNTVYPVRKT